LEVVVFGEAQSAPEKEGLCGRHPVTETKLSTYFLASVLAPSSTADRLTDMKAEGVVPRASRCAITKFVIAS
jgi:hypothetical protein